jgi:hypothetical protein
MPNKIDDKLAQCERAIRALVQLRSHPNKEEFEYHFCAYIGFAGAVRQYIQQKLETQLKSTTLVDEQLWLDGLESNLDVATVIGLRNSDVHSNALRVTNQNTTVALTGYLIRMNPSTPSPPHLPTPPTTECLYLLDPALPSDFMVADRAFTYYGRIPGSKIALAKGDQLPMKGPVLSHLGMPTDLGKLAESSYAAMSGAIASARSTLWGHAL